MSTHRSTWNAGSETGPACSGLTPTRIGIIRPRRSNRSDSTHPRLYVETKLRASSSVRTLWERTRDLARREGKTPVVILYSKGKPGGLIVVHQDDLATIAAELANRTPMHRPGPSTSQAVENGSTPWMSENSTMSDGRNLNGHFAAGNKIGRGNPGNKRLAELRRALLDCVTPEQVKDVGNALYKQALDGDVHAAKVWLEFVIGKPCQAVEIAVAEPTGLDLYSLTKLITTALEPWPEAQWASPLPCGKWERAPVPTETASPS